MKLLKYIDLVKCLNSKKFHSSVIYLSELQSSVKIKVPKSKSDKPIRKTERIPKDINKYFSAEGRNEIFNLFPEKLLKKKLKTPESFYVSEPLIAADIVELISKDLSLDVPFVEVNPGPGYITKELLKTSTNDIKLYEANDFFLSALSKIQMEHTERVSLRKGDFINIWKLAFQDKMDNGNRIETFLDGIPRREWEDGPNCRIFACIGSINFFKHLINSIALQTSLFTYGRPEMYLILPPPLYIHLTCSNEAGYLLYRATTMLFQIMFEHEFLTKFKREHFLPWQKSYDLSKKCKLAKFNGIDEDYMYLIKIMPRQNLYKLCRLENLSALWYFVKQHCVSRKNRIIPTLERWVPGSGPRIILNSEKPKGVRPLHLKQFNKNNPQYSTISTTMSTKDFYRSINIFTQFGDLSPSQTLTLFNLFINWPEYKESSFLTAMENSLLKMETSVDEIQDEDDTEIIEKKQNEIIKENEVIEEK